MAQNPRTSSHVPIDILEAVDKQETEKVKDTILSGRVAEEGLSTPIPERRDHPLTNSHAWSWRSGW